MKTLCAAVLLLASALPAVSQRQTLTVNNRTLKSSNFAMIQGLNIFAQMSGCGQGFGCWSPAVGILESAWNVRCPAPAGQTCTYEITLTGPIFAYSGQDGVVAGIVLSYAGDGNAFCSAESCGATQYLYVPSNTGPIGAYKFFVSVTNTARSQSHPVQINLQCITGTTGVCAGWLGSNAGNTLTQTLATLKTDVYTP
jgi:hypothetical protein